MPFAAKLQPINELFRGRRVFTIISIVAVLLVTVVTGCNTASNDGKPLSENTDSLQLRLAEFNGKLPIELDDDRTLDSVYYDGVGKKVVFNLVLGNDDADLAIINDYKKSKQLVTDVRAVNNDAWALYKELADGGLGVRTVVMNSRGNNCAIEMTPEEVLAMAGAAKVVKDSVQTDSIAVDDRLAELVDSINALLPVEVDRATELTTAQVENNYLVYNYVRDESNGTIDRMKGQIRGWKAGEESKLRKPSPEQKTLMETLVDNGLGIKHRYMGKTTRQTVDYAFSAVELSKISNHPLPEGYEEVKDRIKVPKKKLDVEYVEGIH